MVTKKNKGIPKDVINYLDIRKEKVKYPIEVKVLVETHQVKIPIPKNIRDVLDLKSGAKCNMFFDRHKKEIICKF